MPVNIAPRAAPMSMPRRPATPMTASIQVRACGKALQTCPLRGIWPSSTTTAATEKTISQRFAADAATAKADGTEASYAGPGDPNSRLRGGRER
jgi:hypothetical protein